MALPTRGHVIIDTTAGDIEVELWSKETPKACRNFLALAMEGYYDGVIFHRVVPDFLVQTGDRTGTGGGGESFYGEPFEDEIHPRLRFAHRGLVAMANNGTKNSNDSQFFITLDRADELHGKHTLFGRCVGDTVYNVMKIGAMELDDNGRPLYPPKIRGIRILENPFDDIVPRITAEEKRAQQRAREQGIREREEAARRKGAKKDTKLLSFGADEDGEGDARSFKKKNIARPDLVDNPEQPAIPDSVLPSATPPSKPRKIVDRPPEPKQEQGKPSAKTGGEDLSKIREQHSKEQASGSTSRQAEIQKMEAEIKKLSKRRSGDDSDEEPSKKKAKPKSYLGEELAKYAKSRGIHKKDKRKDESDVMAALTSFRTKLQSSQVDRMDLDDDPGESAEDAVVSEQPQAEGDPGMEVDDDRGFMSHLLHFPKGNEEEVAKAEREYEVIDPRQRGAKAKEEERERKRAMKNRGGGHRR
ncbi:cyclophilin-like protein [Artomyces pyxidatus]|uniref:Cyclophilin-like protein n=1 Tax=Artomyces pyxidatus TaxID=48021 RepID=A0ACB8T7Q0_9AGAM|nr:cyclophilin-like protein [Artomyces pyxidatus]